MALLDGSGICCSPSFQSPALLEGRTNVDSAFIRLYFKCPFGAHALLSTRSPCQVTLDRSSIYAFRTIFFLNFSVPGAVLKRFSSIAMLMLSHFTDKGTETRELITCPN